MTRDGGPVETHIGDASSVLVLAPAGSGGENEACIDLLTRHPPAESTVIGVTVDRTVDESLAAWHREAGREAPRRTVVLDATPEPGDRERTAADGGVTVERIPPGADLLDIGVRVGREVGSLATGEPTQLCFHSVSALFEMYQEAGVRSFLAALNDLCDRQTVFAHHHADPSAHDEGTLARLRPLYDAVVERDGDGWLISESMSSTSPTFRPTAEPPGGVAPTDPNRPETIPIPYSFNTVLDLLSEPLRRSLLYCLKDCNADSIPLDDLVDRVYRRVRAIPAREERDRERITSALVHVHLPKLADVGVISYDADDRTVHYAANPALESCLRYIETLELG